VRRQIYSRRKKTHTRFYIGKNLWRWRALFGVALILFTAVPLALVLNRQSAQALPCPCNVFTTPTGQGNNSEGSALELGFKFRSSIDGYISGVRFYKQGAMGGTHTGRLWDISGNELAQATFTETASGWQEVSFSSAVAVTANTNYVASVTMNDGNYIATANYFGSDIVNDPLTAPSSASSGGNGVYNLTGGAFPTSFFNATNYWVDVSFVGNLGSSAPTVSSTVPTNSATNVTPGESVTATFDDAMLSTSFTSGSFEVRDESNTLVPGVRSYSNTTKTASFVADDGFTLNETYTATLKGGQVQNLEGIALAADYTWSFTIASTNECPCSLKDRAAPAGSGSFDDSGTIELGVKIKPSTNGYITAIRFYKPIVSIDTSNVANIWSSTGTNLASVTINNQSDYGWQEGRLSTPLRANKNQLYIVSYGSTSATYQASTGAHGSNMTDGYLTAFADNSSENAATGSGNRNGVFVTTAGNYPSSPGNGTYYWVDAVFSVEPTPEYPLNVIQTQPTNNSYGAPRDQAISATFNRTLDSATVTNSTFRLFDSSNNQVAGTGVYNAAKGQATFTPSANLTYGGQYTARLSATIADPAGTTLGSEYSWSFTVGSQLASDPTQGPGGPLLVITSTANKYSTYYAEILRAEGLNYFDVKDISTVDATTLNSYQAVVLAEMGLSQAQADMLGAWVNAGGNLVAMRPDDELASLLGLTDAGSTRTNQYLLVNTASTPGAGIVNETVQFKGVADNYILNGATSIATFYSDASTATSNPAVTTHAVGSSGGTAAAFAYDLAKSVIAQHQGNQAWAGQNRDANGPARGNDLFFGAMAGDIQPDWVDPNKFHIPQADEQQRLLANMLIEATKDKRPLPRFWYLPGDNKVAMIMAGDDHGLGNLSGTQIVMNDWLNESVTDCSLADWECVRASHYIRENSAITDTRALQYHNLGMEIGDHVSDSCAPWVSFATLTAEYTADLTSWRAKYSSLPNQRTHRYHCYVWSDWDGQSRVQLANSMRMSLDYVAYPASWVGTKAPVMTGSGMNMRFTDADGDMMDIRQAVTNFDDTTSTTTNINALVDNAQGSAGYYGIFGTHYDMSSSYHDTLLAAAKAKNVPMISSEQALTWLDGRDSSTFSNFGGANGQFTFDIAAAVGANGLKAMLPVQDAGGTLSTLKVGSSNVSYQTQTVKGVQYAVFDGQPGSYTATYSDYDPNAGSGGSSGGGSSGSGSGSGSSGTSKKSSRKVTTTAPAPAEQPTPEVPIFEEEPVTPTPSTPEQTLDGGDEDTEKGSSAWKWIIGGIILLGLAGLLLYIWLHRRKETTF
jgi:hypothetical protein